MIHKARGDGVPDLFFRRDYQDRGMVKWAGYFLSDHTSALKKEQREQLAEHPLSEQTADEQNQVIYAALFKAQPVRVQMKDIVNGALLPIMEGQIESANGGLIWLKQFGREQAGAVEVDDIRHIEVIEDLKWRGI